MTPTERLHTAAKIIRADGCEGIYSASRLVGYEVALGMLILLLHNEHYPPGRWPEADDTVEAVNAYLEREGLLTLIQFSPTLGRGVVFNESGTQFAVEVEKMYQPVSAEGLHVGMWLQGPGDLTVIPAGPHPFRQAYDEMRHAHREAVTQLHRSGAQQHEG